MARDFAILLLLCLASGCGQAPETPPARAPAPPAAAQVLPRRARIEAEDYKLTVNRDGQAFWNGFPIDDDTLRRFTDDLDGRLARYPRATEVLVALFELGAPPPRTVAIRRELLESNLCRHGHCAEAAWDAPRPPIVN